MEKDVGRVKKNENTDIVIRIDDFGGRVGLTIREFVNRSDGGYSGFTKSGTRIPLESFEEFKRLIDSINISDFGDNLSEPGSSAEEETPSTEPEEGSGTNGGSDESLDEEGENLL